MDGFAGSLAQEVVKSVIFVDQSWIYEGPNFAILR